MYCLVKHTVNIALGMGLLLLAATSHASLLDCTKVRSVDLANESDCALHMSSGLVAKLDMPKVEARLESDRPAFNPQVVTGFEVSSSAANSDIKSSAPLLGLLGILVATLLVKAKSCNTK